MALLLILPLLVSGFLVCLKDPTIYCRLHRWEGQMLYLQVARYGIYCLLMSFVVTAVVTGVFSHDWGSFCPSWKQVPTSGAEVAAPVCYPVNLDFLSWLAKQSVKVGIAKDPYSQTSVFLMIAGVLTLVMPALWSLLTVRAFKRELNANDRDEIEMYLLAQSVRHSPICSALVKAFAFKRQVMITMDDRKVYVGHITDVGAPTEVTGVDQEVSLIPSVSGYRDKDTMRVIYTTDYPNDTPIRPIAFRQSNIVSISFFSDAIRESFKRADEARAAEESAKEQAAKEAAAQASVSQGAQLAGAPAANESGAQMSQAQPSQGQPIQGPGQG
ncbi:hypothetical protein NJH54_02380 [Pseudomonas asiatica]|uniref:hypothetical protein n=1 Tax=Pseudomonas asiatica TaxID=2219225 RepID=UPI00209B2573|nr:hypothetical protein [Pseudomonas asiatica]MCO7523357.1 hypothetical protein [Pseudomonas asiatica]